MVWVMIAVFLAASSPAMVVACQTEEWVEEVSVGPAETFSTLTAWGGNSSGQLGDGTSVSRRTTPVEVSNLDGAELKAITGGGYHSLALKDDGTVLAWGNNQYGQLADGTNTSSSTPVQVQDPDDPSGYLSGVETIAAGSFYSLALKNDGTVWAWGNNTNGRESPLFGSISGQLGDDEIPRSSTPVQVGGLPDGIEAIAAGSFYSLALKDDGTVWAWGFNRFGQLGDGTSTDGAVTTCELTGGGAMTNSSCTDSNTPVQVSELDGIEAIAAGSSHGLALRDDGTVWSWGFNQTGQLGNGSYTLGTSTLGINTPMQVGELSTVKAIAGGGEHSLAGW